MKHEDTLTGRMRRFFLDNQDEEMTFELLAVKFDTPVDAVRATVRVLREEGTVESLHVIRHPSKGRAS